MKTENLNEAIDKIQLNKWKQQPVNKLEDIFELSDIQRAILIAENCFENAICFLTMTFSQPDLAEKYFTEGIIIYKNLIHPFISNIKDDKVLYKIDKLESMIKDLEIDLDF